MNRVLAACLAAFGCGHPPVEPPRPPDGLVVAAREPTSSTATTATGVVQAIKDRELLLGATVMMTLVPSPDQEEDAVAISDEGGRFELTGLHPGLHHLVIYYGGDEHRLGPVELAPGEITKLAISLHVADSDGIVERCPDWGNCGAPMIDPTAMDQGIVIDQRQLRNLPAATAR